MSIPTRRKLLVTLMLGSLAVPGTRLAAQLPDLAPRIQAVTERQVERAQTQAVDRAVQQATETAQARVLENTQSRQAEAVQNQVAERVGNQVERAQAQAVERAGNQVDRVQAQVERVQAQVERTQNQIERARQQVDRVQEDAAGRVRERLAERPLPERLPESAAGTNGERARGLAAAAAEGTPGELPPGVVAQQRQTVIDRAGNAAFVEITLEPGVRAIEFEWVMVVTPEQRRQLESEAGELLDFLTDTRPFDLADGELLTFRVPPDLDADAAILQLVPEELRGNIDRNHVYSAQDETSGVHFRSTLPSLPLPAACHAPLAIGMIDTAIETGHQAFASSALRLDFRSFVPGELEQPRQHGTAVAGLLVGEQPQTDDPDAAAPLRPLLPQATVHAAGIYHASEGVLQGATAARILAALDWLAAQKELRVINMSLAGPANRLLEQAVALLGRQGKYIVAAVGNEGPHAAPLYPAAYEGVLGVTAVDGNGEVFRWAVQGPQVDFAALGVSVPTALADGSFGPESGTSMAAPVVAAQLACALHEKAGIDAALDSLHGRAVDLGAPGPDPVYGKGLLHP